MNRLVPLSLLAVLLAGCAGQGNRLSVLAEHPAQAQAEAYYHGVPLSSGQIVLTEEGSAFSQFLTIGTQRFVPYTHAGILLIEDGSPYVYDMRAAMHLNWSGPPTDALQGGVMRHTLQWVIDKNRIVAIFDPPPRADRGKLIDFVHASVARRVAFDPYFDYADHSRYYCAEFVAVAMQQAGASVPELMPIRDNRSLAVVLRWLKFHDTRIMPAGAFAAPWRRVAIFSRTLTPAQITAYFAIKRELHRRFTRDQRLGVLFQWQGGKLRFRPEVEAFRRQGLALAGNPGMAPDPERIEAAIHGFAARYFATPGAFPRHLAEQQ